MYNCIEGSATNQNRLQDFINLKHFKHLEKRKYMVNNIYYEIYIYIQKTIISKYAEIFKSEDSRFIIDFQLQLQDL